MCRLVPIANANANNANALLPPASGLLHSWSLPHEAYCPLPTAYCLLPKPRPPLLQPLLADFQFHLLTSGPPYFCSLLLFPHPRRPPVLLLIGPLLRVLTEHAAKKEMWPMDGHGWPAPKLSPLARPLNPSQFPLLFPRVQDLSFIFNNPFPFAIPTRPSFLCFLLQLSLPPPCPRPHPPVSFCCRRHVVLHWHDRECHPAVHPHRRFPGHHDRNQAL